MAWSPRATPTSGQLISGGGGSGPELFRIADMRQLRLYVHVPQSYAAAMQPNLVAEVQFPDRPGFVYKAKLERIRTRWIRRARCSRS